jgi:hypothetical protein
MCAVDIALLREREQTFPVTAIDIRLRWSRPVEINHPLPQVVLTPITC